MNIKNSWARLIAALVSTVMLIHVMPMSVAAGGDGSQANPYIIGTAQELAQLAERVNAGDTAYNAAYYRLSADIDLSAYGRNFNGSKGWIPIGYGDEESPEHAFRGVFDGTGHTVTGLYINDGDRDQAGLFGVVYGGSVRNLGIVNAYNNGNDGVGGVAGAIYGIETDSGWIGDVNNCFVTGKVIGGMNVGGLAGMGCDVVIRNCYASCDVAGTRFYAGGIAGSALGCLFYNCYATGAVSGDSRVGGIAGQLWFSFISDSAALNPSVKGADAGRIAGCLQEWSSLSGNVAFSGMTDADGGNKAWTGRRLDSWDGADISANAILADGTLGGRFTSAYGWTAQNGKLPGFGAAVDMPPYISSVIRENPFEDVQTGDWFYDDVVYVYNNGLMNGTDLFPMRFSPGLALTRGMIVSILYRLAGSPDVTGLENPFDDVPEGAYYAGAVKWAAAGGIVYGDGDSRFAPKDSVTRQDLAVILMRYMGLARMDPPRIREYPGFTDDAAIAGYAREAVRLCYRAGIVSGKPDNRFDPEGTATRAEAAAMLCGMLGVTAG